MRSRFKQRTRSIFIGILLVITVYVFIEVVPEFSNTDEWSNANTAHRQRRSKEQKNPGLKHKDYASHKTANDHRDSYQITTTDRFLSRTQHALVNTAGRHMIYSIHLAENGRLGNIMFQYASLFGITQTLDRKPVADEWKQLREMFMGISMQSALSNSSKLQYIHEEGAGIFSPQFYSLPQRDVQLCCYLQSWKYFKKYSQVIRQQFTFQDRYKTLARRVIRKATADFFMKTGTTASHLTYIGVHVRRADITSSINQNQGFTTAPRAYIEKAMTYFRNKHKKVLFIVCSDELGWAARNLGHHTDVVINYNIQLDTTLDTGVDMAVLMECNHTIMTVGTFGWCAAWLTGGEVVYYKDWLLPGSTLAHQFKHEDYFPPHWIPMSD